MVNTMDTESKPMSRGVMQEILLKPLHDLFGFRAFRPNQEAIVSAILGGGDAFVVMPTGGGKSLCYQLPAHLMPGVCLVISPLISLMKDQVDAAKETGLRADFMNSSQSVEEQAVVMGKLVAGEVDLLYVSPERFAMPSFKEVLSSVPISFVAIDEAHCISEWGHDFRPDYLNLSQIRKLLPGASVAAFTATATLKVQQDIIGKLGLRNPHIVRASFNRPNLYYQVQPKTDPDLQILSFIRTRAGEQGIVYRTTRKNVESTADMLCRSGISALPYHAGLDDDVRTKNQEAFNRDEVDVIVATIAFGMGIDKSNVRFVAHADLPKNVEGYYQETGRAGRDGMPAHCLLLFGHGDIPTIRYFIDQLKDDEARRHATTCLNDMVRYGSTHACRRKQLLAYFGETYPEPECGMCDVCVGEVEKMDATEDAQMVMSAILRTGSRFGATHIIDVVTGADTQKVRQFGHEQIKTYGLGKEKHKRHWRAVIDQLLAQEWISQTEGRFPMLRVDERARAVLRGEVRVSMLKSVARKFSRRQTALDIPCNEELFEALRSLRKQLAVEHEVPPFVIFSDRTLREMAARCPTTPHAMGLITGVGAHKMAQYGSLFMGAIRQAKATPWPNTGELTDAP